MGNPIARPTDSSDRVPRHFGHFDICPMAHPWMYDPDEDIECECSDIRADAIAANRNIERMIEDSW